MKKRGFIGIIFAFVLIVGIIVLFFTFYFSGEKKVSVVKEEKEQIVEVTAEEEIEENESVVNETKENASVFGEARWDHMPLTYKINDGSGCSGTPLDKLEEAFFNIESKTDGLVKFEESKDEEADIEISCVSGIDLLKELNDSVSCEEEVFDFEKLQINPKVEGLIDEEDYLINATLIGTNVTENFTETTYNICYIKGSSSGASNNFNTLKEAVPEIEDNVILSHSLNIYVSGEGYNPCAEYPAREVHELLHGLGIDHTDEPSFHYKFGWIEIEPLKDVMFPYQYCLYQTSLSEKYSSCLKSIYGGEGDCENVNLLDGNI
jgi:hypothetical protein